MIGFHKSDGGIVMKTIKERAIEYCKDQWDAPSIMTAYMDGATEQKAIDDEVIKKLTSIMEHSASVLGIGTKWFNEDARRAAIAELKQEILNYLSD